MKETAITRWSKAETHCVVCQRPLAADAEEQRHAERECDPERCWCLDFCWVGQGGDCIGDPFSDMRDDLGLWMRVRSAEEEVARLRSALLEAAEDVQDWGAYASDYFQEKWDLDGDVAKYRALGNGSSGGQP